MPSRVRWVPRERLDSLARRYVQPTDVVLDVGPGIRPQALVRARAHICLDAHRPYLDRVRDRPDGGRFVLLHGEWRVAMAMLPDRSVDSVIALDVIEHFTPEDGRRFLVEAARVARRQIVLFTPIGFYPQSHTSGESDRWGLDGGEWQSHRSGWTPDDFGSDWRVLACRDYHLVGADGQALAEPFGAMWAFRDIAPREGVLAAALGFAVEDALYALRRARRVWLPWLSDERTTVGRVATAIHRRLIR